MKTSRASILLSWLGYAGDSFALLGKIENDTRQAAGFESADAVISPDTLPPDLRVDVALLAVQHEVPLTHLAPVLARLRDVHARQILLVADGSFFDTADLVALGFEVQKSPADNEIICTWDPATSNKPREWNDARNWANPENFAKFRW